MRSLNQFDHSLPLVPIIQRGSYGELTVEVWFKLSIDHFHGAGDKAYLIGHDNGGYDRAFFASDGRYGGFGQGLGGGGGFAKPGIGCVTITCHEPVNNPRVAVDSIPFGSPHVHPHAGPTATARVAPDRLTKSRKLPARFLTSCPALITFPYIPFGPECIILQRYPPQNKWHHGVAVFGRTGSSGASFVALNNKQGNTATARAGEGLPKFQIGGLSVSKGHGMRGLIKRVRQSGGVATNRALS